MKRDRLTAVLAFEMEAQGRPEVFAVIGSHGPYGIQAVFFVARPRGGA